MDKNKYLLGLYEKSMPNNLSLKEKLIICKETGFDYVELSIDETDEKLARLDWDKETIDSVIKDVQEVGVRFNSICLSGHRKYPLGSLDEKTRARALEIMEKAVDLASELGIRIIQIAGYDVYYEESNDKTKELFLENLKKCVLMASRKGIVLGFETMETEFMDSTEKAMKYVELVDSPYLGVYPDLGNCTNAAVKYGYDVLDDLKTGKGHVVAMHLKEMLPGKYREVPFGTGNTDFQSGIKVMKDFGVGMYVGEFWYVGQENWLDDIKFANKFLREHLDKVYN